MSIRRGRTFRAAALVASLAALSSGLVLAADSAQAAWVSIAENGLPGHLSLLSDPDPADLLELSPGSPVHWQIRADLSDAYSPLTIQFERAGELTERPDGLWLQARACDSEWSNFPASPQCSSAVTVLSPRPASSPSLGAQGTAGPAAPSYSVGPMWQGVSKYILVTLSLPDTPEARADSSLMGLSATVGVGLTVLGDQVPPVISPPGGLAYTGSDVLGTGLVAFGGLGLGLLFRYWHRRRQRLRGSEAS